MILNGFNKVDESISPERLPKGTLQSLLNMILDGEGLLPTKRNGFTRYNTNVLGSDAKSIHEVKDEDGDTYLLASNGTLLSKSLAGTGAWSDVKTGLTTGLRTKIANYNSQIIVTNGTDAPFVLEGSGFGTVNNLALETPDMQGSAIASNSGGSLDYANPIIAIYLSIKQTKVKEARRVAR